MKITLNELRQIVKSIIKEEMTGTPSAPAAGATANTATVTPFDTLAQTLSTMNPKPTLQRMTNDPKSKVTKIMFSNRFYIDSKGNMTFDDKYMQNPATIKYWVNSRLIIPSQGNINIQMPTGLKGFSNYFKINIAKPNEIKTALEGFFSKFPL